MSSYRQLEELIEAEIERVTMRQTADITTRCPYCKLPHTEYDEFDDEWHIIECDRCGRKYKYHKSWF